MLSFSHANLLVSFDFMVQTMTGACVTLLQPMQRGIYQKPLMTSVPHDHSYIKHNKTRRKKKWGREQNGAKCGGLLRSNSICTLIYEM